MITHVLLAACLGAAQLTSASAAAQLGDTTAQVQLDRYNQVHFARGQLGFLGSKPELVDQYVTGHAALFGLRADEHVLIHADRIDALGQRHLRLNRTIHGVPVEFDEIRLHAAPTGLVYAIESELSPLQDFTYRAPALTPWEAIKTAEGGFKGKLLEPSHAELVVLGQSLDGVRGAHLAYRVHVAFPARPGKVPVIEDQYIDAATGEILAHLSRVYTDGTSATMSVSTLDGSQTVNVDDFGAQGVILKDISLANGPQIYTVDSSNNGSIYQTANTSTDFSDPTAGEPGSVAYNVATARSFFESEFGWNRWDFGQTPAGSGGLLAGFAHEGQNLANAYFVALTSNGQVFGTMHYGDGDGQNLTNTAKCLDVTGHEMGHGVVQGTAGLVYHNQSGALNEHFADVFGWIFKHRQGQNNDYIGDQCVGPNLQPALRDMCNPTQVPDPQPDNMANYVSSPDTDDGDHGGVHTNSGIPNKAACLVKQGTAGVGIVGAIWFKALHDHLGSTASFQDMVNATMTSCSELIGSTTQQSDCDAVAQAWTTVGLAAQSSGGTCPANSTQSGSGCVCNSGYQPDSTGNCVAIATKTCPDHATFDATSGNCYCDTGYEPSTDGTSCVAVATGGCGDHSHLEGGACVCDTCYVFSNTTPGQETGACVQDPSCNPSCNDPGSNNDANCDCLSGLSKDANGKCTVPTGGSCGTETFAGRCDGNTLIYCYTAAAGNTNGDQVIVYDCSTDTNGATACGPDTVNGGYNCVAPVNNCGSVPYTGQCNADNTASYCSDGTVQKVDCSGTTCIQFQYSGYGYNFCNPCPTGQVPIASGQPDASGNVQCQSSAVGSSSGSTSGGSSSGGSSGTTGSGGDTGKSGCSATSNNAPSLFLILTLVGLVAARRRK